MASRTELVSERRDAIEKFKANIYGHGKYDILALDDVIGNIPVASKEDALAVIDLILDEVTQPQHHLIHSSATALRKFIGGL